MRRPDRKLEGVSRGISYLAAVWIDPTDLPWDGDFPLPEGSEGWDVSVEVTAEIDGERFSERDSLGSIWIEPNRDGFDYLDECIQDVTDTAVYALHEEILRVSTGVDVEKAKSRQNVAVSAVVASTFSQKGGM